MNTCDSVLAFKSDKKVLYAVIQALISIIVRNEYCQHFYDVGGLELLRDLIIEYSEDEVNLHFFTYSNAY